jgi:2-iminobutanoate/2-iminopropanoate deaminase
VSRKVIQTDRAPGAVGPYSQAIASDGLLFVSGQIPMDPETGQMVDGDVEAQAERALRNVEGILEAAGGSLQHVVRATVWLTDMGDFEKVNEVYARFFGQDPPARVCVEVSRLPKGARVEIDAIARI